jgi:predicted Zn finger-like uncharacterized protein
MDVSCEKCHTEYELDDTRVPETGVPVKCTTCGHVFNVKKAVALSTPMNSHPPLESPTLGSTTHSAPTPGDRREWKIRQASGKIFSFRELTNLQRWIVERKVARDDEISLTGETWKRLGHIVELASFFQVVDEAQKAKQLQTLQTLGIFGATPPAPAPVPTSAQMRSPRPPAAPEQPQQLPPPASSAAPATVEPPAPISVATPEPPSPRPSVEPHSPRARPSQSPAANFARKKSAGETRWLVVLLACVALGGAAALAYVQYRQPIPPQATAGAAPSQAAEKADPPPAAEQEADPQPPSAAPSAQAKETPPSAAPTPAPHPTVAAPLPAQASTDGGSTLAESDVEERTAPTEAVPAAETETRTAEAAADAGTPVLAAQAESRARTQPRNFDWYMAQGERLRDRNRPAAALDAYGAAADLAPSRSEPVAGKGFALLDLGHTLQAEATFREALRLNPRYAVAVMGLAETYRQMGKNSQAIGQYERYLEILPNGSEAQVARGAIERLKE